MNYFNINAALEVTAISGKLPEGAVGNPDAWWSKTDGTHGTGWASRNDFDSMMLAQQIADSATRLTGRTYIATDAGEGCYPRFDVIEAPAVGDEVSYAFNGDYYPCGRITSISKTMKLITTDTGRKFYRQGNRGLWLNGGMWSLVAGHISRMNPEF